MAFLQVDNYDITVSDDAKFLITSTWHHEAKVTIPPSDHCCMHGAMTLSVCACFAPSQVWNLVQKNGGLSAVTKVMSLNGHAVRTGWID